MREQRRAALWTRERSYTVYDGAVSMPDGKEIGIPFKFVERNNSLLVREALESI